jgi:hypothetical protein
MSQSRKGMLSRTLEGAPPSTSEQTPSALRLSNSGAGSASNHAGFLRLSPSPPTALSSSYFGTSPIAGRSLTHLVAAFKQPPRGSAADGDVRICVHRAVRIERQRAY